MANCKSHWPPSAGEAQSERLYRIVQRTLAGGVPERALVYQLAPCQGDD